MSTTYGQMKDEILSELANGEDLDDIKDRQGEFVDSYLPVYYNRIIEEWKDMPMEYTDRGHSELGLGQEISIFNLMSLDLYVYYSDIFTEVIDEVEQELADKEEVSA